MIGVWRASLGYKILSNKEKIEIKSMVKEFFQNALLEFLSFVVPL